MPLMHSCKRATAWRQADQFPSTAVPVHIADLSILWSVSDGVAQLVRQVLRKMHDKHCANSCQGLGLAKPSCHLRRSRSCLHATYMTVAFLVRSNMLLTCGNLVCVIYCLSTAMMACCAPP